MERSKTQRWGMIAVAVLIVASIAVFARARSTATDAIVDGSNSPLSGVVTNSKSAATGAGTTLAKADAGTVTAATACWTDATNVSTPPGGMGMQPKQYSAPPEMVIDPAKTYTATMETNKGTIEIELYPKDAPQTVNNFVCLARDGYYDGTPFHRIVSGFVIQGGDPTGTGSGGRVIASPTNRSAAITNRERWRWRTPVRTRTAASFSSCSRIYAANCRRTIRSLAGSPAAWTPLPRSPRCRRAAAPVASSRHRRNR